MMASRLYSGFCLHQHHGFGQLSSLSLSELGKDSGPSFSAAYVSTSVCWDRAAMATPSHSNHTSGGFPLLCPMQALVIAGISLQAANLYGYILCKMGGEGDISTVAASFLSQTVFQTVSD